MTVALKITDGTTTISLFDNGYQLSNWNQTVLPIKDGGIWRNSPLTDGRVPVMANRDNIIDTFEIFIQGSNQDQAIYRWQELGRLLEKAREYWTTDWQDEFVWIEAQASCETNARYAIIYAWQVPELNNPYSQPFMQEGGAGLFGPLSLVIEHGPWLDSIPDDDCTTSEKQYGCDQLYLDFIPARDGLVNCGSGASLDDLPNGAAFTVEAWIKLRAEIGPGAYPIAEKGLVVTSGWILYAANNTYDFIVGAVYCAGGFINSAVNATVSGEFTAGEWQHILFTYDDTGDREVHLAVGGRWSAGVSSVAAAAYQSDAALSLLLGSTQAADPFKGRFDGGIAWVRVSDIQRYDPTAGDFTPEPRCTIPPVDANVVLLVVTEDDAGVSVTTDLSGNGNDGAITAVDWACGCPSQEYVEKSVPCNCVEISGEQTWNYSSWEINDSRPVGDVRSIIELDSGYVLACENNEVWRQLNGSVWQVSSSPPSPNTQCYAMHEASDGYVYLVARDTGTGQVECWRSNDNGVIWSLRSNNVSGGAATVIQSCITERGTSGELYIATSAGVYQSVDGGTTWNAVYTSTACYSIVYDDSDPVNIMLHVSTNLPTGAGLLSSKDGIAWSRYIRGISSTLTPYTIYKTSNGKILASLYVGGPVYSLYVIDVLTNYVYLSHTVNSPILGADWDGSEYWILYANGETYRSVDAALGSWFFAGDIGTGTGGLIYYSSTDFLYAGEAGDIYYLGPTIISVGREATCTDEVMVVNKQNTAQLTDVFVYDSTLATYSPIYPSGSVPTYLFPNPMVIGDILYIGIDTSIIDSGPFSSAVFDLYQALIASGPTFAIEYWNGAWVALTVYDETGGFQVIGVGAVSFVPPTDWTTNNPGMGVTGYWIRFRVTGIGTWVQTPIQWQRSIYTVVRPSTDIDELQVPGDISAIARVKVHNRSDRDGEGGSAPDAWQNRVLVGLRSVERGSQFTHFINFADEQNPIGITVTDGANTAFANSTQAPSGRYESHTGTGLSTWSDEIYVTLGPSIARDYYGQFHCFIRARQASGTSGQTRVRLKVQSGAGGASYTLPFVTFPNTTDWNVLDMGIVTLPTSTVLSSSDLGDSTQFIVQLWTSAGVNSYYYDMILLPVDEWVGDFIDNALEDDSSVENGYLLDVDSVSFPKVPIRSPVRSVASDQVRSIYEPITPGPFILQANADQRLHFFCLRYTYSTTTWTSEPWIINSVQLTAISRYLAMRGDR